jgi:hypothetical protein
MVKQQPQFKAGIAHRDFKSSLPCLLERLERSRQIPVAKVVIGVQQNPELIPDLDFPSALYICKGVLQPINNMNRCRKSRIDRRRKHEDSYAWQMQVFEILSGRVRIIRCDDEYSIIAQSALGTSDRYGPSVEQTHSVACFTVVPGFS